MFLGPCTQVGQLNFAISTEERQFLGESVACDSQVKSQGAND